MRGSCLVLIPDCASTNPLHKTQRSQSSIRNMKMNSCAHFHTAMQAHGAVWCCRKVKDLLSETDYETDTGEIRTRYRPSHQLWVKSGTMCLSITSITHGQTTPETLIALTIFATSYVFMTMGSMAPILAVQGKSYQ